MKCVVANFEQFSRKALCALLPGNFWISRRMRSGVIVSGLNRPGFGGRGFFVFGEKLEQELYDLDAFLNSGDVFVDIGANTGAFSMKAARRVGKQGLVIAIEPQPSMLLALHRNVVLNKFENVHIRNLGLNERSGLAELWLNGDRPASASLNRSNSATQKVSCLCLTLDELVQLEQLQRIDYIKIDTEGTEAQILRGGHKTIEKFKPAIQIEVSVKDVPALAGYECWRFPGSSNALQIPVGHRLADVCAKLGYQKN
jgi:FkbM family methyltransferase